MEQDNWLEKIELEVDEQIAKQGMPTKEQLIKEIRLLNASLDENEEPYPC
jgi:hypothetical protein